MAEETATAATRQRRKRKWDQPAEAVVTAGFLPGLLPFAGAGAFAGMGALHGFPSLVGAYPNLTTPIAVPIAAQHSIAVQQSAAAAVVQKFNQDLMNKGLLPQAKIQDELIAREITINDAEAGVRYKLTKRQTQEEIQVKTGAVVITRGRYRPSNGPVESEKPLYLHISAGVHLKDTAERIRAVDQAAAMVEDMLKQGRHVSASSTVAPTGTVSNGMVPAPFAANIYVGFEADPSFNLMRKIRGPNDQYINHIMNETGATVTLRGRGSGCREVSSGGEEIPQPLHMYITSDNSKSLEDAKVLAENLLQTIRSMPDRHGPGVVAPASSTYSTTQSSPYQPSGYPATGLPHVPYGGYHLSGNGTYPPPYVGSQPLYYPPVSAGVAASAVQSSPASSTATDIYTNRVPPSKVYAAVPPPVQLLGEQSGKNNSGASQSSSVQDADRKISTDSSLIKVTASAPTSAILSSAVSPPQNALYPAFRTGSTANTSPAQSSQEAFRPSSFPPVIMAQAPQPAANGQSILPASTRALQSSYGHSQMSSYSGYSGVYPQASPLQQVAQALQRPPPPVSLKPGLTPGFPVAAPTRSQAIFSQEKQSDKQHTQRRKFQEFPVSASKEFSGDEQHVRRGASSSIVLDPKTCQESCSSSKSMPPPPDKIMPSLPPQKDCASIPAISARARALSEETVSLTAATVKQPEDGHVSPHRTGLKLVEYGEEEEESSEHAESPHSSNGITSPSFFPGKPFWAA
ncbi:hypothetical protein Mapa_014366 [Marchantia paleacea]|nr:hypothetical protein Mapa_014366 [Marchantia paleacea]